MVFPAILVQCILSLSTYWYDLYNDPVCSNHISPVYIIIAHILGPMVLGDLGRRAISFQGAGENWYLFLCDLGSKNKHFLWLQKINAFTLIKVILV